MLLIRKLPELVPRIRIDASAGPIQGVQAKPNVKPRTNANINCDGIYFLIEKRFV